MIDRSADATELVEEVEVPELAVVTVVAVAVVGALVELVVLERLLPVVLEVKSNLLLLQVDMDESVAGGGLDGKGGGSSVISFS